MGNILGAFGEVQAIYNTIIIVGVSSVFIIGSIFNTVMVMRNKSVAEVEGGIGIAQDVLGRI